MDFIRGSVGTSGAVHRLKHSDACFLIHRNAIPVPGLELSATILSVRTKNMVPVV